MFRLILKYEKKIFFLSYNQVYSKSQWLLFIYFSLSESCFGDYLNDFAPLAPIAKKNYLVTNKSLYLSGEIENLIVNLII